MTDKEMNLQTAPRPKTTPRGAKPPIGKTAAAPAATPAPEPAAPASPPRPAPKPNGKTAADIVSTGREALLGVDSYEQAETVLTEQPALIEQARAVFGSIVPTSGQNQFIDLAINAAADDDPTDLRSALKTKRRRHLNLTSPEIG
ncbi:MAG: hypothetical protein ACE5G8_18415, partial [Anaerolineae bacterium]